MLKQDVYNTFSHATYYFELAQSVPFYLVRLRASQIKFWFEFHKDLKFSHRDLNFSLSLSALHSLRENTFELISWTVYGGVVVPCLHYSVITKSRLLKYVLLKCTDGKEYFRVSKVEINIYVYINDLETSSL